MSPVEITYFSDVLCVWAYASQARIEDIKQKFGEDILIDHRFCSVFGDSARKITSAWKDKGGYDGFNSHLQQVADRFPHVDIHPEIWLRTRPPSSASAHLFMKAVQHLDRDRGVTGSRTAPGVFDQVMWAFRCAFFRDCRDISHWDVQCQIAESVGADVGAIEGCIHNGTAFARLAANYEDAEKMRIEGSPTFVLNEGRQKFYGNIGARMLEANVQELLRGRAVDDASWC
jgi:predicted DsbA family dithiol-disulfide isomerase